MKWIFAIIRLSVINMRDIRIYPHHLALLVFLCLPNLSNAIDIPANWNQYIDSKKNTAIYQPSDIDSDFLIKYYPAATLDGKEVDGWLRDKLANSNAPKGKWLREEKVDLVDTSEVNIANINIAKGSRVFINPDGSKGILQAIALSTDDQLIHLTVMIFSQNEKNKAYLNDAGEIIGNLLIEASQATKLKPNSDVAVAAKNKSNASSSNNTQKVTPKSDYEAIEKAIRVPPGQGVDLSDIEVVWVDTSLNLILGGLNVYTYLLLKDGSVYWDCMIPPNELNVTASKNLQPKKWSVWKKSWGNYQIKDKEDGSWSDLEGQAVDAIDTGSKLKGKYVFVRGSHYAGPSKRTINFFEDGTFEISSSAMMSNSEIGGGGSGYDVFVPLTVASHSDKTGTSSSINAVGNGIADIRSSRKNDGSKNTGRYQINDYTITMMHDNGWNHTELFIYEDTEDTPRFIYGNNMYYYDDD
ncbi:MAG: hypothetical protein P8179_18340 [Candidatus Thiodiazotropha sp.]|jgi:hypothetical protein